jgi:hypothetical protein
MQLEALHGDDFVERFVCKEVTAMKRAFSLPLLCLFIPAVASAIDPAPAGQVRIFRDYQCTTGPSATFAKGSNIKDLRQYTMDGGTSWNDQISCIVIGAGVSKVIVYEHINYGGRSNTLTRTTSNPIGAWSFAADWWNDKISSFKIQ